MPTYIEKTRVPIRLSQPNLAPRDGWLLLLPHGQQGRSETVVELLNSSRMVIPFIQEDLTTLLLTRVNIDWVAIGNGVPAHLIHPTGPAPNRQQRVQLRFIDESRVDAVIEWRDEKGEVRLSDLLNASGQFVAARTGFGTLVVNTMRIRETQIAAAAPSASRPQDPPDAPGTRAA